MPSARQWLGRRRAHLALVPPSRSPGLPFARPLRARRRLPYGSPARVHRATAGRRVATHARNRGCPCCAERRTAPARSPADPARFQSVAGSVRAKAVPTACASSPIRGTRRAAGGKVSEIGRFVKAFDVNGFRVANHSAKRVHPGSGGPQHHPESPHAGLASAGFVSSTMARQPGRAWIELGFRAGTEGRT